MIIKMETETPADIEKVIRMAQCLIDSGAECRVYIGTAATDTPPEEDPPQQPRPSLEEAAQQVMMGMHGIGPARIESLKAMGYTREERIEIQNIVNNLMKGR